jgi:hypothetical protein
MALGVVLVSRSIFRMGFFIRCGTGISSYYPSMAHIRALPDTPYCKGSAYLENLHVKRSRWGLLAIPDKRAVNPVHGSTTVHPKHRQVQRPIGAPVNTVTSIC